MTYGIDLTQALGTAATVFGLALGVALMVVLAVVPLWLRYDAQPAHPARRPAGPARADSVRPVPAQPVSAQPAPAQPGPGGRHALAA